ncbi:hypothetical protein [Paenibacillus larvae]|uniref:Uncharacterized protein n=1 Tax=Paenibacillus larvae subsp. larvae TaxID=147375 RepID=A0A6C0QUA0_9BACL|nr:hypothetical protein [Paenibacillus larvae]QHZ52200.1 hypothetical protein ERICV_03086 [Paenibacillus larvae subsp. larvae]
MNKSELLTKLDDTIEILESARDFKDTVKTIVSREHFLEFHINLAIEDLHELKELINEDDVS